MSTIASVTSIFFHPFMRNAFLAGTGIAAACGLVGYFVVLRGQVFTGDALSHVAFTGALAALAAGFDLRLGLFGATIAVAVGMGLLGRNARADDVVIGSVFAWMLGLAVTGGGLLIAYYTPYPVGAFITTLSFVAYVIARVVRWAGTRQRATRAVALPEVA